MIYSSVLFIVCICFATCSNEESNSFQLETSIMERFATCKEVAVYHSAGLDFAYNKLKEMKKMNLSRNLFFNVSAKEKVTLINSLTAEFVSQQYVVSNLSAANEKIDLLAVEKIFGKEVSFRSSDGSELSQDVLKLCDYFDSVIDRIAGPSEVNSIIENAIQSTEFTIFSADEQNTLLMMFAIYEDSSVYWEENLDNWKELINSDKSGTNLRAGGTTTSDDSVIGEDGLKIWKADALGGAIGIVSGAIGGAIGGAVIGSLAGGVGAGPGAIAGGIGGAVSGGIAGALSASITAAVTPSLLAAYSSSDELFNILMVEISNW